MRQTYLCIATLIFAGLTTVALADDKKKANPDIQETDSKAEKVPNAKFIDFSRELGLELPSLEALGKRIEDARKSASPIDLALSAKLLSAAESAAGPKKKASLTSKTLMAEAIDLAKQRDNPTELRTLAKLVGGANGKDLTAYAKSVVDKQPAPGEKSRSIQGHLKIINHKHVHVDVYVNGRFLGSVGAHRWRSFHVHGVRYATVRDHYGRRWHRHFPYHIHLFTWTFRP